MVTFAGLAQAHILKKLEKCMELFLSKFVLVRFCLPCSLFQSYELLVSLLSTDTYAKLDVVGNGPGHSQAWGCDLSYDYVKINAEYTT